MRIHKVLPLHSYSGSTDQCRNKQHQQKPAASGTLVKCRRSVLSTRGQGPESQIRTDIAQDERNDGQPLLPDVYLILPQVYSPHCLSSHLSCIHPLRRVLVIPSEPLPLSCSQGVLGEVGLDISGQDISEGYTTGTELCSHGVKDAEEGMLGASVGRSVCLGEFGSETGDADHLSFAPLQHVRHQHLQVVEGRMHVQLEHTHVVREGVAHQVATHRHPRVLHHHIHPKTLPLQLRQQLCRLLTHLLVLGHVEGQQTDPFGGGTGLTDPLEFLDVACGEDETGTQPVELVGQLLADTRGGTSDPHGLSSEVRFCQPTAHPPCHRVQQQQSHQSSHYHLQQTIPPPIIHYQALTPPSPHSHPVKLKHERGYRKHLNSIGMQKSSSFHTHSRNCSGLTNSRGASPHSRTKIKLVSPLKQTRLAPKENHPPAATTPNFYTRSSEHIELGGKALFNQSSQSFFVRSSNPAVQMPPEPIFRKSPQFCLGQPVLRVQSPQRAVSPPRICINNKCFDLGAIRSQVVFVTPLHQPRTSMPLTATRSCLAQAGWPSELVIQEENAMEELKESYESELREPHGSPKEPFEMQLKEIQQLQQEIAENNLQIKELLNSSRVSRELNSSRLHQPVVTSSEENFAAELLSQTQPLQIKTEQRAPQVSVQTEEGTVEQNENRWSKFSISRSKECQIQLLCSRDKQKTTRTKEEERTENLQERTGKEEERSEKSSRVKEGSRQLIQSRVSQKEAEAVVLLEGAASETEMEVREYAINLNLKASRACSETSFIQYSRFQIQFQQKKEPSVKSGRPIEQEVHPEQQEGIGMLEVVSSVISSGKRRINNSIYL